MKIQTYPSFDEEKTYWSDRKLVIGVDEVGRGAFAGPIVAAGVVFSKGLTFAPDSLLKQINDSKQVKPLLRGKLAVLIKENALFYAVAEVDVHTINKIGIGKANKMAFRKVISDILLQANTSNSNIGFHLLVDGFNVKFIRGIGLKNQKAIVKGDQKSYSIAAASIIAKVHRDKIMKKYGKEFPIYAFAKNKGYGTRDHREALKEYGLSALHRYAFCKRTAEIC